MKKYKYFVILFLFIIVGMKVKAQNSNNYVPQSFDSYFYTPQNLSQASPQTSEFAKYGNLGLNYYNGLLDFELNLYDYKDRDFQIPISIKYLSDGFKPQRRPSIIGNNWILNLGGVITREVIQSPDDMIGNPDKDTRKNMKDGILAAIKKGTYKAYSPSDLENFSVDKNLYDLAPDIFTFSFGAYKGKFLIGNDGKPLLLEDARCRIDISGLTVQSYSTSSTPQSSIIKITTPDGFIYEFGGNTSYFEYFIPNNPEKAMQKPVTITSWFLKTITAPNKRKVIFNYTSKKEINKYKYHVSNSTSLVCISGPGYNSGSSKQDELTFINTVFTPRLNSIVIDDAQIIFERTARSQEFYTGDDTESLAKIDVKYADNLIKTISFEYEQKQNYFFLKKLNLTSKMSYLFDYNFQTNFPSPETNSTDPWGFWTGGYEVNNNDVRKYLEEKALVVPLSVSDIGLLKMITYPTGGKTAIEYERNTYNFARSIENAIIEHDNQGSTYCGGERVKTIKDFDPVTQMYVNSRVFSFERNNNNNQTVGSGSIAFLPKFSSIEKITYKDGYVESYIDASGNPATRYVEIAYMHSHAINSTNTLGTEQNLAEYHVGYSEVFETLNDGSKIQYKYSSFRDTPDEISNKIKIINDGLINGKPINTRSLWGLSYQEKYGLLKTNDISGLRGKLKEKKIFDKDGKCLSTEQNEYKGYSTMNAALIVASDGSMQVYYIPKGSWQLTKSTITDENNLSIINEHTYDDLDMLQKKTTETSDGAKLVVKNIYPYISFCGINELVLENRINEPIIVWESLNDKITKAIRYDYKKENNFWIKHNLYQNIRSFTESESLTNYKGIISDMRETYNNYDLYGNPVYVTMDGVSTVYLWGYKGRYLLAKISNIPYATVSSLINPIFGVSDINTLSSTNFTESDLSTKLNTLRNHIALVMGNAYINTYTYKPLIGMSSATDISGNTTFYQYDTFNRLERVYFMEGTQERTIESYQYNIQNQLN